MFWKKTNKESAPDINWQPLNSIEQFSQIKQESESQPVLIFKHSNRCGISSMALNRLEREWSEDLGGIKTYFLDLITYRDVSNATAQTFEVGHQSPQVILVKNGKAVYDASHMSISTDALKNHQ